MEQATQQIGSVGSVTESFSAGVAAVEASLVLPQTAWGLSGSLPLKLSLDSKVLIAYLAAKIGGPIPAEVASFLEMALAAT